MVIQEEFVCLEMITIGVNQSRPNFCGQNKPRRKFACQVIQEEFVCLEMIELILNGSEFVTTKFLWIDQVQVTVNQDGQEKTLCAFISYGFH